jgi:hypothetical protein
MTEVTDLFIEARECIRDLWNQHYRHLTEHADAFDVIDWFKVVRQQVLIDFIGSHVSPPNIFVQLNDSTDPGTVLRKRVERPQVVTWMRCESLGDLATRHSIFVDFFDFAERDLIDLRYVETSPQDGSDDRYLFEVRHARFFVADEA